MFYVQKHSEEGPKEIIELRRQKMFRGRRLRDSVIRSLVRKSLSVDDFITQYCS